MYDSKNSNGGVRVMTGLNEDKHLIGDVSKMCNVPKKTLRYYDDIDIIKPEKSDNSYRYYSTNDMYNIIILKYFKQLGYSLEEIKENLLKKDFNPISKSLENKIKELERNKLLLENRIKAAQYWKILIEEAEYVLKNFNGEVKIKELDNIEYLSLEQDFNYDYQESIINIDWVKTLEMNDEEIEGPVIINFEDIDDKAYGLSKKAVILQKSIRNKSNNMSKVVIGGKFISTYHIGSYQDIFEAYERIRNFIKKNSCSIRGDVFERYVVDYWTTGDDRLFVTEILVPIE